MDQTTELLLRQDVGVLEGLEGVVKRVHYAEGEKGGEEDEEGYY